MRQKPCAAGLRVPQAQRGEGIGHGRWAARRRGFVLAAVATLLTGCARMPERPADPPWVITPPADTAEAFFGVGEGVDLAAARRSALRDIAARLRVSVSGVLTSQTTVSGAQVSRSQSSRISEEVHKTEFRNPVLVASAASPQGVYALVRVDRAEFLRQTRERIEQLFTRVRQLRADVTRQTPLERFALWQQAQPLLVQLQAQQAVLGAGVLTAEDRQRQATVAGWQLEADAAASALVLALRHRPEEADVAAVLSQALTSQGLRLTEAPGQANAWLELATTVRSDTVPPATVLRLGVQTRLRDPATGRIVGSREHALTGHSLIDAASARQQALRKWQQELAGTPLAELFELAGPPAP